MPTLTIFRGLPGAGKTTKARKLQNKTGAFLIERDMFFVSNRQYNYDASRSEDIKEKFYSIIKQVIAVGADIIVTGVLQSKASVRELLDLVGITDKHYTVNIYDLKITEQYSVDYNIHRVPEYIIHEMSTNFMYLSEENNPCSRLLQISLELGQVLKYTFADFYADAELMRDFIELSRKDFLESYDYLHEFDYLLTKQKVLYYAGDRTI